MTRRPNSSIVANPVLVGASTLLVVLVAVFLAYNANTGLPFVPTYDITALVRNADELNRSADVRIGGKRVGLVTDVTAVPTASGEIVARLALKLDQAVGPLPADTLLRVRPRSVIGLKYVQLAVGDATKTIPGGGELPLRNARDNVDLQDALDAFDAETRAGIGHVTTELGSGLAARGTDFNTTLAELQPLVRHLTPVMRTLAARETDLDGLLRGLDAASAAVAPVAGELGGLFDGAATTLHAIARVDGAFGRVLDEAPATERAATEALRTATPVLVRATRLAERLEPGVRALPAASRGLAGALDAGAPVLDRAGPLADRLSATLQELRRLIREPATGASVRVLTRALDSLVPTLRFLNPLQTRCNYLGLYMRNGASILSEGDANGNWYRFMPLQNTPDNPYKGSVPAGLHIDPYVDTGQHGRCVAGNETFAPGTQTGPPPNAATAPTTGPRTGPPARVGP
jgi:ABC-type transporter Mla subunit MlaD